MGSLFDFDNQTELPDAGLTPRPYECYIIDDGFFCNHSGGKGLRYTGMGRPEMSYPISTWVQIGRLRRPSHTLPPDALLLRGGVALIDFVSTLLEPEWGLPSSSNVIDI